MSTGLAQTSPLTAEGPAAWRASVVTLEPLKREPFELKLWLTPVWDLRSGLIDGSVISRTEPPGAAAADLEEIDVASFAYASALLEAAGDSERLWLPVSFVTLATQRARERLLRLTGSVRELMRTAVVVEIVNLDAVPPSRLMEVAGLMRGLCSAVTARARPNRASLDAVRGCGLAGVAVEAVRLGLESPDPAARLNAFAAAARDIGSERFIHGLPSGGLVDLAAAAGFSQASVNDPAI